MAMGRRKQDAQPTFWVATSALPAGAGHPYYERVNRILDGHGFDGFVEGLCRPYYADKLGRPSLPPALSRVAGPSASMVVLLSHDGVGESSGTRR